VASPLWAPRGAGAHSDFHRKTSIHSSESSSKRPESKHGRSIVAARRGGPELILQIGVSWSASNVAFSPDGRLLASMDFMAGSIKLWEVSTPESRATFSLL
jgi:WD40 repeat protein